MIHPQTIAMMLTCPIPTLQLVVDEARRMVVDAEEQLALIPYHQQAAAERGDLTPTVVVRYRRLGALADAHEFAAEATGILADRIEAVLAKRPPDVPGSPLTSVEPS